jgi:hypothetical protein
MSSPPLERAYELSGGILSASASRQNDLEIKMWARLLFVGGRSNT